jgi:hypothetical protein
MPSGFKCNYAKGLEGEQHDDERDFLGLLSFAEFQSLPPQTNPEDANASRKGPIPKDENEFRNDPIPKDEAGSRFGTIPKDEEQSTILLAIAHKKCFAFQQHRYAHRLQSGRSVRKDEKKSREYFDHAVRNGFPVRERFTETIKP